MTKNQRVTFTSPNTVQLLEAELDPAPNEGFVRIQTEKSVVSAATELACLRGTESWAPLPFVPGYGSVGRVVETGAATKDFKEGERVFTYSRHEQFALTRTVTVKIPEDLPGEKAALSRMASIAITSLRYSDAEMGDPVAVIGLGLVGNFAAQLFTLAGCDVVGIDPAAARRKCALDCGIEHAIEPGDDLEERVRDLFDGQKCRTVVDATGLPSVIEKAPALAGKNGELILLGSPRGEYRTDLTAFLNFTHLANFGNITIKGAHEWRFPVKGDPSRQVRHSIESNVKAILKRVMDDRIKTTPLISRVARPEECADVYAQLRDNPGDTMGVVFDWDS